MFRDWDELHMAMQVSVLLEPLGYCSITDCVHEAVGDSGH